MDAVQLENEDISNEKMRKPRRRRALQSESSETENFENTYYGNFIENMHGKKDENSYGEQNSQDFGECMSDESVESFFQLI